MSLHTARATLATILIVTAQQASAVVLCEPGKYGVGCPEPPRPPDDVVYNNPPSDAGSAIGGSEKKFEDIFEDALGSVPGLSEAQEGQILEGAVESFKAAQ